MKRLFILAVVLFSLSYFVSSCEKCTVCTATIGTDEFVEEYCGSENDLETFEIFWADSFALIDSTIPTYCSRGPYE